MRNGKVRGTMSQLKYCQGPKCHTHKTKDRIRGPKGDKHYETRKRSSFYYLGGNACDMRCQNEWFVKFGNMALDHFGRLREPKRQDANSAWYKDYVYVRGQDYNSPTRYNHFFINDLLGERRPITEQQYNDENLRTPPTS